MNFSININNIIESLIVALICWIIKTIFSYNKKSKINTNKPIKTITYEKVIYISNKENSSKSSYDIGFLLLAALILFILYFKFNKEYNIDLNLFKITCISILINMFIFIFKYSKFSNYDKLFKIYMFDFAILLVFSLLLNNNFLFTTKAIELQTQLIENPNLTNLVPLYNILTNNPNLIFLIAKALLVFVPLLYSILETYYLLFKNRTCILDTIKPHNFPLSIIFLYSLTLTSSHFYIFIQSISA